jgi:hypothetical protein
MPIFGVGWIAQRGGGLTLNISNEDGTIHLGDSWFSAIGESIPKAKPPTGSTFCPMPGGRSQAVSDAPRTEAVLLEEDGE